MRYNLTPFYNLLTPEIPSHETWKERFTEFFEKEQTEPLYDQYVDQFYEQMLIDIDEVNIILRSRTLIDEYSGLFSFHTPDTAYIQTFNMANYIRRNTNYFYGKTLCTISRDYGTVNNQIKMSGLNLGAGVLPWETRVGGIISMIGNKSPAYPIYPMFVYGRPDIDVYFLNHMFISDQEAHLHWNAAFDMFLDGKEVYFTTNKFEHLQNHALLDRIEQVEDPLEIYSNDDYSNLEMGYSNKIYRIV